MWAGQGLDKGFRQLWSTSLFSLPLVSPSPLFLCPHSVCSDPTPAPSREDSSFLSQTCCFSS